MEEGIIIIKNKGIDFQNQVFIKMIQRLKLNRSSSEKLRTKNENIQKLRFLKIFRKEDEEEDCQMCYNLEEILEKSQNFLNDKVFEIDIDSHENAPDFKYVHLKVKKIKN